ncbi:sugar phosphate isomerase/epimerase family protein [Pollutibacter soli]|uniref:sugar phosphate isomerase/epimerase family protein n=1 Tax=Pollutibacter soli TaxID=3034157 RepID=UPI0030136820
MSAKPLTNLEQLCIHTITTKPWAIEDAVKHFAASGVKGITVWRDALHNRDIKKTGEMIRNEGLNIVSLCRGGFFPAADKQKRNAAIDDNKKAIEEAEALGAPLIVLVCGADPAQSLEDSRTQIQEGIEEIVPVASAAGVKLAIEPLHPMYADTRSAINTLAQANDIAGKIDSPHVGVAVDVYHLWWDPHLKPEIERCGRNNHLFAFHICDWNTPTTDLLLDRGLMGDGCIPVNEIRGWVEATGFNGFYEVEIFSNKYWSMDQQDFLKKIISAYKEKS